MRGKRTSPIVKLRVERKTGTRRFGFAFVAWSASMVSSLLPNKGFQASSALTHHRA